MPTDTIYGIVGKALEKDVVERIYRIKKRNPEKPFIILIGNTEELKKFSVVLSEEQKSELKKYWFTLSEVEEPKPTSIVLDCLDDSFAYLHRGTKTLAFRIPVLQELRDLLLKIGPLIAPSANKESFPPSVNIEEAKKYFGDLVDFYKDGGILESKHSKLIKLSKDGSVSVIRK